MPEPSTGQVGPDDLLLEGYIGYLRRERGVAALTISAYLAGVRQFLAEDPAGKLS